MVMRERERDIYFPMSSYTNICCQFFQNGRQNWRLGGGHMINADHLPVTPKRLLVDLFLMIGTPWCFHMQIQKYLDYYRGNAIFQLEKSYIWFLKKEIKRIYYQFYFWTLGQMRSGKWTGREAQKTQLYCLNVVIYVHKSGEHSAETHYNGAMKQWRICRGFTYLYLWVQWSKDSVAEALHI